MIDNKIQHRPNMKRCSAHFQKQKAKFGSKQGTPDK